MQLKRAVMPLVIALLLTCGIAIGAQAQNLWPHAGTIVVITKKPFADLVESTNAAIKKHGFFAVTRASASAGAARRGVTISGNLMIGVYRNDYAVRMLEASVPAGMEAPIRLYLMENPGGTSTLAYRTPTSLFAPYGSAALDTMAAELDAVFEKIAADAAR
jgi:uncharacterized protein (DUF302 family)